MNSNLTGLSIGMVNIAVVQLVPGDFVPKRLENEVHFIQKLNET